MDLYALKADLATLSDAEWDDVIQYGNSRSEIIMGVTVHRANPTIVEYSTALAVTYHSSRIDQVSLEASIEAQLERYIDDARVLGRARQRLRHHRRHAAGSVDHAGHRADHHAHQQHGHRQPGRHGRHRL